LFACFLWALHGLFKGADQFSWVYQKGISLENETLFFSQAFNLSIGEKDK
jgi:hypothetical protein